MKKFIFMCLLSLVCFHTEASTDKHYVSAHLGTSWLYHTVSLGYGQNLMTQEKYYGFAEVNVEAPFTVMSGGREWIFNDLPGLFLKYGYEFMRDSSFSFGLDVLGFAGYGSSIKAGSEFGAGAGVGAFLRFKMTSKWSALFQARFSAPLNDFDIMVGYPNAALGIRYHF